MEPAGCAPGFGAFEAAIAGVVGVAVMRRLFPAREEPHAGRPFAELRRDFFRWDLLQLVLVFGFAALLGWIWCGLFVLFSGPAGFGYDGESFQLRPIVLAWALPSGFLGLISGAIAADLATQLALGSRYAEYVAYQKLQAQRMGIDWQAAARVVLPAIGGLAALAVLLLADWGLAFTPVEIRVDPLFGLEERVYAYDAVIAIETAPAFIAPNGKRVQRREHVLRFADGTAWNTRWDPSDANEDQIATLIAVVSERSGVPVTELPLLPRKALE
jgi:hypothetical protein